MSADLLRRAAALIRERALAATPGPWWPHPTDEDDGVWHGDRAHLLAYDADPDPDEREPQPWDVLANPQAHTREQRRADTRHIASWDPTVARFVAELLDNEALYWTRIGGDPPPTNRALLLARAYLGEDR